MQNVIRYTQIWEDRCYSDGIPDDLPAALLKSGRAPSWKAVAIAILQNDHRCASLGFSQKESFLETAVKQLASKRDSVQIDWVAISE